jgi:hypothetical protein
LVQQESVPSILESEATGEIAELFSDIRTTLGTSVVNQTWRNLTTMPPAPQSLDAALAACRLFVEHPIARMTGICAIIRHATPA